MTAGHPTRGPDRAAAPPTPKPLTGDPAHRDHVDYRGADVRAYHVRDYTSYNGAAGVDLPTGRPLRANSHWNDLVPHRRQSPRRASLPCVCRIALVGLEARTPATGAMSTLPMITSGCEGRCLARPTGPGTPMRQPQPTRQHNGWDSSQPRRDRWVLDPGAGAGRATLSWRGTSLRCRSGYGPGRKP